MSPKVSIVVPVYNVSEYLKECMDSIVGQTLRDIEIICVNDGSTDDSLAMLQDYASRYNNIKIIDKSNAGYGAAMNDGFDAATGEYIGIVEPDDYIKFDMYETLYNVAKENDLDFVKADFFRFAKKSNGNVEMSYNHLSPEEEEYNVVFKPGDHLESFRYIMNTWSGIYRRSYIEEHGMRHNTTPGASFQDNGFWFQTFVNAERAMIIDTPLYYNRRDNPNSSVKDKGKVYAANKEYDYIRDLLMCDEDTWNHYKGIYWLKKLHNYQFTLSRIADESKSEYVERCGKEFKHARERGELIQDLYNDKEWGEVNLWADNPQAYLAKKINWNSKNQILTDENLWLRKIIGVKNNEIEKLKKENDRLSKALKKYKNSKTYKIGSFFTFIPRKLKGSNKSEPKKLEQTNE